MKLNGKTSLYSLSKMSEFRKSIAQMGTTVPNGNVVLDPTKMRREPRLDVESIIKTPHADKQSWRIYSRIFYGDSLYRRMLKYLSTLLYNHYMMDLQQDLTTTFHLQHIFHYQLKQSCLQLKQNHLLDN